MPLTIGEFDHGVQYWLNVLGWPADFHNEFYAHLAAQHDPNGNFDLTWWKQFRPHLKDWAANRPVSNAVLATNLRAHSARLTNAWHAAVVPSRHLNITQVTWQQVAQFPAAVAPVKGVTSPVFTSKFCHFLAPAVFPVVDNAAIGGARTYQRHFERVKEEWRTTPPEDQQRLVARLTARIAVPLVSGYPLVNKIVDVCLIGRRHGGGGNPGAFAPPQPPSPPAPAHPGAPSDRDGT